MESAMQIQAKSPTNTKISTAELRKMFPTLKDAPEEIINSNYLEILEVINKQKECEKCTKEGYEAISCRMPNITYFRGQLYESTIECEKSIKEQRLEKIAKMAMCSGVSKRFKSRKFDSFKLTKDNKKAFEIAKRYADKYPINNGLLITGPCGTGKTHIAVAILHAILEKGYPGLFVTVPDLLAEIRKSFNNDGESKKIKEIMTARFLVLDDLGAEKTTDWVQEQLYMIINHRYEYELPTVITSNLNIGQLAQKIGERSASRLLEMCYGVKLNGEDYRAKVR